MGEERTLRSGESVHNNKAGKINGRCLGGFSVALAKTEKRVHAEEEEEAQEEEFHILGKRLA